MMKKLFVLSIFLIFLSCNNSEKINDFKLPKENTKIISTEITITPPLIKDSIKRQNFPEVKDVTTTKKTNFVTTLEEKVDLSQTQIYCSTLLYAWQEIKTHFDNNLSINNSLKELVLLNNSERHLNSLLENEIETSIKIEPRKITAEALFTKSLAFEFKFKKDNFPLTFMDSSVQSFGIDAHGEEDIMDQIEILFYNNDNDFGIKLICKDEEHEVLLYLPEKNKEQSLGELSSTFLDQINKNRKVEKTQNNYWKYHFLDIDQLSIPALKLNLEKNDSSLVGNHLLAKKKEYIIAKAYQRIALILDEKGTEIKSDAAMKAVEASADPMVKKIKPKNLIFDKPFLLVFKRIDTDNPYLVLWIANNELMIKQN